jgi:hypothetical protein
MHAKTEMVGTSVSALRAQVAASGDPTAIQLFDQLTEKKSESLQLATLSGATQRQATTLSFVFGSFHELTTIIM